MHALHLSTALGAFVAGVMLAESPYRHELESDVEPFRSILLGLFFLSVGMMLDLNAVAARPVPRDRHGARRDRHQDGADHGASPRLPHEAGARRFGLGLLLSQAGEFGFVLFAQATARAARSRPRRRRLFGAIVTLSMATTPFLMRLTDWLERREAAARTDSTGPNSRRETSAIVVGYGRFGQTVAQMLHGQGDRRHPDRQEARADRAVRRVRHQGLLRRRPAGSTCCAPPARRRAKVIAFCNDNEGGELSRERAPGGARGLPAGVGHGPRVRSAPRDRPSRARPRARRTRAVRKRRGHGQGRASARAASSEAKWNGSSASIGCATASGSSARAKPATSTPAGRRPSARAGHCRTKRRPRPSAVVRESGRAPDDRLDHLPVRAVRRFSRGCVPARRRRAVRSRVARAWPSDRRS